MVPRGGASLNDEKLGRGAAPGPRLLGGGGGRGPSNCDLGPRGASEFLGGPGARLSKLEAADGLLSENRGGERDLSLGTR